MYVNAWLNEGNAKPGDYPSGCPESHVMDIWQAGAPHIDMLCPDLYASNFAERCQLYTRQANPLFIPEMQGSEVGAQNAFVAFGSYNAIGTSPFGIDRSQPDAPIGKTYQVMSGIAPFILDHPGQSVGFVLDAEHPRETATLGGYTLDITLDSLFGRSSTEGCGLIVATGDGEFVGAGSGFRVAFRPTTPGPLYAGIGTVDEMILVDGKWTQGRRLNGDETDQGWGWRFSGSQNSVLKCKVYRYD
jgi:hypothetical protein